MKHETKRTDFPTNTILLAGGLAILLATLALACWGGDFGQRVATKGLAGGLAAPVAMLFYWLCDKLGLNRIIQSGTVILMVFSAAAIGFVMWFVATLK